MGRKRGRRGKEGERKVGIRAEGRARRKRMERIERGKGNGSAMRNMQLLAKSSKELQQAVDAANTASKV